MFIHTLSLWDLQTSWTSLTWNTSHSQDFMLFLSKRSYYLVFIFILYTYFYTFLLSGVFVFIKFIFMKNIIKNLFLHFLNWILLFLIILIQTQDQSSFTFFLFKHPLHTIFNTRSNKILYNLFTERFFNFMLLIIRIQLQVQLFSLFS